MLGPEEIIFKENEMIDTLYILTKGEVDIILPTNLKSKSKVNHVIYTKKKGDTIGEI